MFFLILQLRKIYFHVFSNFTIAERGLLAKALYGSSSCVGGFIRLLFWLLRSHAERGAFALHFRMFIVLKTILVIIFFVFP
jgi:hypothetical protein